MGKLVESQIERAAQALTERDSKLASDVVERDERVDEMAGEVREYAVQLLARRQPMARDLRLVITAGRYGDGRGFPPRPVAVGGTAANRRTSVVRQRAA